MSEKDDKPASRTMRLKTGVWDDFQELAERAGMTRTQLFITWVANAMKDIR